MSEIVVLISFLCVALLEIFKILLLRLQEENSFSDSIYIPLEVLEYSFLLIALILSIKGLFYKNDKSKKLNFIYVIASIVWLSVKVFETLTWY